MISWADIHKVPSTVYTQRGKKLVIDEDYANAYIENFRYCKEKGYEVVVLRDHGEEDSWIYGDVVDVRFKNGYLQAGLKFTRQEELDAFNEGLMREFSPGFDPNWIDPHTGEERGPTLLEVSFTKLAHQRNLRKPQSEEVQLTRVLAYTLSKEIDMAEETKVEFNAEERIAALEEKLVKVMEALEAMAPKEEMMDEPEEQMMDDEKEEMSRRIQHLEDQVARTELSAAGITEDVDSLVKLKRADAKLFASTVKKLSRKVQTEIGAVGATETRSNPTIAEIAKAAKDAGKDGRGELPVFLSQKFPDYVTKVAEVRKAIKN